MPSKYMASIPRKFISLTQRVWITRAGVPPTRARRVLRMPVVAGRAWCCLARLAIGSSLVTPVLFLYISGMQDVQAVRRLAGSSLVTPVLLLYISDTNAVRPLN